MEVRERKLGGGISAGVQGLDKKDRRIAELEAKLAVMGCGVKAMEGEMDRRQKREDDIRKARCREGYCEGWSCIYCDHFAEV